MNDKKALTQTRLSNFSGRLFLFTAILVIVQIFSSKVLFSQTSDKNYTFGALFLPKEQYEKLPRPNWDTLEKYSNAKAFLAKSTTSIKMLVTPPIGNQGSQGSCVGWATGYTALGILTYPKYNCWDIGRRSPNYVFNQIKQGSDCTTGAYTTDGLNLVKGQGSCSWTLMPYIDGNCTTLPNSIQTFEASKHNAISWSAINPTNDVAQIKQALDLGLPVVVAFNVYQTFIDMWNSGGIWSAPNSGYNYGGHAVCVVGYDDTQQMFKVQNQWGLGGDQGFFWMTYNLVTNNCLQEVYILSGMNSTYPETISGPTLVCSSGATFTLNNLPSVCTVSWNKSSNLTLSSTYANTASFTANGNGSGWIEATINSTVCSSFTLSHYNIWAGTPVLNVTGPSEGTVNNTYSFYAQPIGSYSDASNYTWTIDPLTDCYLYPYYNTYCAITFYTPHAGYRVKARAQNTCGTGTYAMTSIFIGQNFLLSPNPASETVTVTKKVSGTTDGIASAAIYDDATTIYTIRIIDFYGALHYSATKSGESFTFPVSSLKDGQYIVQITEGKNITNLPLIVKH